MMRNSIVLLLGTIGLLQGCVAPVIAAGVGAGMMVSSSDRRSAGAMVEDDTIESKAQKRIDEFVRSAGIFVLASHTESFVRQTCNKAILLDHGHVALIGTVDEVFARYGQRA